MLNKEENKLVEQLKRIFPNMEMVMPTELFNNEEDCMPEHTIDWYEFLKKMEENGLKISNIKTK